VPPVKGSSATGYQGCGRSGEAALREVRAGVSTGARKGLVGERIGYRFGWSGSM